MTNIPGFLRNASAEAHPNAHAAVQGGVERRGEQLARKAERNAFALQLNQKLQESGKLTDAQSARAEAREAARTERAENLDARAERNQFIQDEMAAGSSLASARASWRQQNLNPPVPPATEI